ncbi:hypothetical protein CFC21_080303 [Triticum aestivum]|uniref:Aminotransferase-like plant mobile domain-containing protein n=2 Tax=Triticum aestivum TaxID=4565 RepID=A0A3B6N088_WHEAT|nr:uncharacterized protein LOC123123371 isoform X2 [Triticum aestivum]KAF7075533.1 hypothetical protein CFC21_080303 [Triticum aestivum]
MARGRPPKAASPAAAGMNNAGSSAATTKRPPTVQTSFTSVALQSLAGEWNPEVRSVLKDVGMDELCKIRVLGNTNRIFSMSLISRINPDNMMMDMGDGVFIEINSREVARCIGLAPGGGRKIDIAGGRCLIDREDLLGKVHGILGTGMPRSNNIPVHKVKKIVQGASKVAIEGDERTTMKVVVTLLASSTFLVPRGATAKIANELLPVVADPETIAEFDFCDYVVEGLREAARKLRDDLSCDPPLVNLTGCLVIPQMIWLDYHEHGRQGRLLLPLPRLVDYSDMMLRGLIRKHAIAQGIECGLEIGDIPRSPSANIIGWCGNAPKQHCESSGAGVADSGSNHDQTTPAAAGGFSDEMKKNTAETRKRVLESFKAAMDYQYQRREDEFLKVFDSVRESVMGEIKKRAAENRRKELEGTLDFFLAHMKQHAFVMPVFPVNTPDAPRNGKSAVA